MKTKRPAPPTAPDVVDLVAQLRLSKKFIEWRPSWWREPLEPGVETSNSMKEGFERHYTPQELAEVWGVSVQTIRQIFDSEEGVLKIGRNGTRTRRRYKTLRIPESVAERVHTRLSA